ncbi:MAG: hypothetical protein HYZ37_15215 [Candidatus Solibacter usitatus]|nr:hypothetical protein [Candidatus Solibacter usitatus]
MASKKQKARERLNEIIARANPAEIDEALAAAFRQEMGSVSDSMWRSLLRECGVPLSPLLDGVRQEDFFSLERTLLALGHEYAASVEIGTKVRAAVIRAKDHAKFAARNEKVDPARRAEKEEMVLWMLTWLENPSLFALWVPLRKQQLIAVPATPPE